MPIHCEKCGARVASRAALPGHYRKAHRRARGSLRRGQSRAIVPTRKPAAVKQGLVKVASLSDAELIARFGVRARREPLRAEIVDVASSRMEIIPASRPAFAPKRSPRNILAPDLRDAERPPAWWEPQADPEWRVRQWNTFSADYRSRLAAQRAGTAFTIRSPQATDAVLLWSQFHALKALATRLDAGVATERELVAFVAALKIYNENFDRIAQRKALPGG